MEKIGLRDLIDKLKSEIGEIQLDGSPMFFIEDIELELKFVVEKTGEATGKVQFGLFAAEAKGEYKDQHVNTVTLTLKPIVTVGPDGNVGIQIRNYTPGKERPEGAA